MAYSADPSDVVASATTNKGTLLSPPENWPACFKENAALKGFMGKKQLNGKRVRLVWIECCKSN